jgi:hypothetical protein
MIEERRVYTAYIGDTDPFEWTMYQGKPILMPVIFKTCKDIFDAGLEEKQAARIEAVIRGTPKAFDFWVKREEMHDTLDKVMNWALDEEEYEMCGEIKELQERLRNEDFSYRG